MAEAESGAAPEEAADTARHGALELPAVRVDSYNVEIRDGEGFVGDRASGRAFKEVLDGIRHGLGRKGDPLGPTPTHEFDNERLDQVLNGPDHEAAALVHSAVEAFAQKLAGVMERFLGLEAWAGTQRLVVGGGMRQSRIGELAVGRAGIILKGRGSAVELALLGHDPDEAGLIGCVQLDPPEAYEDHDAVLAVDVGGTNIRCGVVALNRGEGQAAGFPDAEVWRMELWKHGDEDPRRDEAVDRMADLLKDLSDRARRAKLKLAPFVGIGCPGVIEADGSIARGAQNLPGNWESSRFNLPAEVARRLDGGDGAPVVVVHNDAVVQGLSEVAAMADVRHWGILTIGTGLGNARFSTRHPTRRKGRH